MKIVSQEAMERVRRRLVRLYGDRAPYLMERFYMMIGRYGVGLDVPRPGPRWTEKDAVLITYADALHRAGEAPLTTLRRFLEAQLTGAFRTVHLLPFAPWSSDDGFSVIDYRQVAPQYGTWDDIEALSQHFQIMGDIVLNHCSSRSPWFRDFFHGIAPATDYFITVNPHTDLSQVVRPRPWPLLTEFATHDGKCWVWTTFSEDQVDLDWKNPDVLFEFIDILLLYLSHGMRIFRLDAVAYLWKEAGTACIHLEETHEIVKLFRDIVDMLAPQTIILTETNVPHQENISYLGDGDEAHMVYQFSLPPLLLYSLLRGDCRALRTWAADLEPPPPDTTFLNFTASHDGIGLRPLDGLVDQKDIDWLVSEVISRHGRVSYRRLADGSESPYELNITYFSALSEPLDAETSRRRFLCSQAVALSLQGIPAIYFASLLGTPNDLHGLQERGHARAINRQRWSEPEIENLLNDPDGDAALIFPIIVSLLRRRSNHPAFQPAASQAVLDLSDAVFAFTRTSPDGSQHLLCLFNVTDSAVSLPISDLLGALRFNNDLHQRLRDLATGLFVDHARELLDLPPYQFHWLVAE